MPLDANLTGAIQPNSRETAKQLRCGRYPAWGVIHTHPQAERWACTCLQRAGYRTYLPLYAARIRDRVTQTLTRVVERPLFPNYAFVVIAERDPWVPIRYSPGVHALLMAAGKPQMANTDAVSMLQASEDARRYPMTRKPPYRPGAAVTPRDGPFGGLPGVVLTVADEIATVGILFLGQLREIPMPFDSLVPREDF